MANMYRKRKMTDRATERHFRFVVQIPVPEGGFASALDAMKAWHCYSASMQRPAISPGDHGVTRWSFESMQIAEEFRLRFGGELGSARDTTIRQAPSRDDAARQCCDEISGPSTPAEVRRKRG
jgi:hypothetical protein